MKNAFFNGEMVVSAPSYSNKKISALTSFAVDEELETKKISFTSLSSQLLSKLRKKTGCDESVIINSILYNIVNIPSEDLKSIVAMLDEQADISESKLSNASYLSKTNKIDIREFAGFQFERKKAYNAYSSMLKCVEEAKKEDNFFLSGADRVLTEGKT